jgi:predicted TIM-barrel fold metal-dependent hydrolase
MTQLLAAPHAETATAKKFAVIDTDNHPGLRMDDPVFQKYLPQRWREYLEMIGLRFTGVLWTTPPQRSMTHRLDAVDDDGRTGYSIPLIRKQLLDQFDMSGSLVTGLMGAQGGRGGQNCPEELSIAIDRASNDAMREHYLEADPRFYGTINVPMEIPSEAVKEIQRVKDGDMGARYVEVLIEPSTDYPLGNPKYWPIFEALEHYNLPLAVHVGGLHRRATGTGQHNFYFEAHVNFALRNYSIVPSMIFEGVFDRFPNLKLCLTEQSWSWAVPFAWRLDATHRVMRNEVSHLQRKPSDYIRDNFYFHTQPLEETEFAEDLEDVYAQFTDFGLGSHLMFSSDYPHWDSDSPHSLPEFIGDDLRRDILGATASRIYNIPLRPDSGIVLQH